jgi:hypothetical protein
MRAALIAVMASARLLPLQWMMPTRQVCRKCVRQQAIVGEEEQEEEEEEEQEQEQEQGQEQEQEQGQEQGQEQEQKLHDL